MTPQDLDEENREDLAKALNLLCRVQSRVGPLHAFTRDLTSLIASLEKSEYFRWLESKEFAEFKEKL